MLLNQGLVKLFCQNQGILVFIDIVLNRSTPKATRSQVLSILSEIVQNNTYVQQQFLQLNYIELLKLWFEDELDLRQKVIGLISGILGGNNLEVKRDFL